MPLIKTKQWLTIIMKPGVATGDEVQDIFSGKRKRFALPA
jgi:hypothetical protein